MILSSASVPLLGLVDTAILGHLSSPVFLAASALGASALSFMYWGFGFLRMGTTGETAQTKGKHGDLVAVLMRSVTLALLIAVLLVIFRSILANVALAVMAPLGEMRELAISYCEIRMLSAPAVLINYALMGWFIGRGETRMPMIVMISVNALNIPLDWILVVEMGLNSDGAAYATVVADYVGLAVATVWTLKVLSREALHCTVASLMDVAAIGRTVSVNLNLFVRTVSLLFAFAFFHSRGALFGPEITAANAILMNLLMLTAFGLDGFALSAETLVGQALGAKQREVLTDTILECARWSALTTMLFFLLYIALMPWTGVLFSASATVQELVREHYGWLLALPLVAAPSYLYDGVFVGATRSHEMRNSMLLSVFVVFIPLWYSTQGLGNHGLWLSFALFSLFRGLSLGWIFHRSGNGQSWLSD